jgi:hypothetical protein
LESPHFLRDDVAFTQRGAVWADGRETNVDTVIWCTGFRIALDHFVPLGVIDQEQSCRLQDTRSVAEPQFCLAGYGEWTGYASATIIGVGRTVMRSSLCD